MKMDRRYIFVLLLFWSVVGLLMFINGLRYGHWEVAMIRNIYLPVIGAILCVPISLLIDNFQEKSNRIKVTLIIVLAFLCSVLLGVFLNPLTLSLLGAGPENYTLAAMTNQMIIYFILFCVWSWLYDFKLGFKQAQDSSFTEQESPKTKLYYFEVLDKGQLIKVTSSSVSAITANGDYVNIHTGNQTYLFNGRMNNLTEQLEPYGFTRIHRSTLVNSQHIKTVVKLGKGRYKIGLLQGATFDSSKTWQSNVQNLIPIK